MLKFNVRIKKFRYESLYDEISEVQENITNRQININDTTFEDINENNEITVFKYLYPFTLFKNT